MKILDNIRGLALYLVRSKSFNPKEFFYKRRVAVIGAADSTLNQELGRYIDGFDFVIRINKALITYSPNYEKFLGKKTDLLIHNFHENMDDGGGGPIDWKVFDRFDLKYLVQAKSDLSGKRNVFNYYKKYLQNSRTVYLLPSKVYRRIIAQFVGFTPTRGFIAIYIALISFAEEVYLTGFTFFKTPYANGYRDNIQSVDKTMEHIERQGFHNAELEFENFKRIIQKSNAKKIYLDNALFEILNAEKNYKLSNKVMRVNSEF